MTSDPQPQSAAAARASARNILLFSGTTFFFWAALYLYSPILPVYAQSIGADLPMVGTIVAMYALPQMLLRIPIGLTFDTLSRRKPLVAIGVLMAPLGALGLGLATHPWLLALARTVTGIGAASWVALIIYYSAYYPSQGGPKRAVSIINFVQGCALVAASYFGGLIAERYGYGYTFFGAAVLGAMALICLLFTSEPPLARGTGRSWAGFKSVATSAPLLLVSFMGLLSQFANWAGLFGFVPVYAARIGASSADLGMVSTVCLASSAVASLATVRVTRLWGNSLAILVASLLLAGAIAVVPLITSIPVLEAVMVLNGIGRGLLGTLLLSLSIQGIPGQHRATAMGIYSAIYAIGMLTGPLLSGFLADSVGLAAVFYLSTVCCVATAIVACLPATRRIGKTSPAA